MEGWKEGGGGGGGGGGGWQVVEASSFRSCLGYQLPQKTRYKAACPRGRGPIAAHFGMLFPLALALAGWLALL